MLAPCSFGLCARVYLASLSWCDIFKVPLRCSMYQYFTLLLFCGGIFHCIHMPISFTPLSDDGHLGSSHREPLMNNNAAMSLLEYLFLILWAYT